MLYIIICGSEMKYKCRSDVFLINIDMKRLNLNLVEKVRRNDIQKDVKMSERD
jgi:hypothetical protein